MIGSFVMIVRKPLQKAKITLFVKNAKTICFVNNVNNWLSTSTQWKEVSFQKDLALQQKKCLKKCLLNWKIVETVEKSFPNT